MPRAPELHSKTRGNAAPDARLEAAIDEAVFRYWLQRPLTDVPRPLGYYLVRQGQDPDDVCLRRTSMAPGATAVAHSFRVCFSLCMVRSPLQPSTALPHPCSTRRVPWHPPAMVAA
jgi:hypothetical protein